MKCQKCQVINRENRLFCKRCGFRLLSNCPQCGFANEAGDTFCGGCGRQLRESAPANSPTVENPRNQTLATPSLPRAFLENILNEESPDTPADSKEEKKAVSQEEIDKLFNN